MSVHLRPQARRRLRYLADLAGLVATPLVPADYLDMVDPLRAGANELRGRVTGIRRLTDDAVAIDITPGRAWRGHRAGQYLRVGVDIDGVRHWRTYSLTSPAAPATRYADRSPERLSIAVKAVPGGLVSTHLVRRLRAGELLYLGQATGDFVLPDPPPARVAFITGGSGITPVIGILRTLVVHPGPADVVLVHGSRHAGDAMFAQELRDLAAGPLAGVLTVHPCHSDDEGYLTPERLEQLIPDLAERTVATCGPAGLVDLVTAMAAEQRTGPLLTEPFTPPPVITGTGGTAVLARAGTSAGTSTDTNVEVDGATSILDAAERAGAVLPSGCRMGICFRCVLPLTDGAVSDLRTGEITVAADGVTVQTCINTPAGSCRLDA